MKIRDIELIGLEYGVPEAQAYGASRAMMSKRQTPLFLLHTEEGVSGVGEALTSPLLARANLEFLKPHFIGTDIHDRDATWSRLLNRFYHLGLQNPLIATYSGVNVAMLDALGKGLKLPVHKLLGGKARSKLTAYASNGYVTRNPQADLEGQLEKLKGQGYKGLKIKIGLGPDADEARCAAVRRILGNDMVLMVDVNGNYTAELALASMRRIDSHGIHWYEEPLPPQDYKGYAHLRSKGTIPVAAGESHHTAHDFLRLLESGCIDIAQPDVCSVGGLDEARRIADLCRLFNIRIAPHVWGSGVGLAAAIHFAASIPPYPHADPQLESAGVPFWLEYDVSNVALRDGILTRPFAVVEGMIEVPDAPGLGIELDPEGIERYRMAAV